MCDCYISTEVKICKYTQINEDCYKFGDYMFLVNLSPQMLAK